MLLQRCVLVLVALGILAPEALATWSIVVINRRTGEVGVTSATCIENLDLRVYLPVVVPGKGAAAAQSFIDTQARNRKEIRMLIEAGFTSEAILDWMAATDTGHQTRQYGMVSRFGPPVTFTGTSAGAARFGVVGTIEEFEYAIQGNVLTGDEVVLAAELAFRNHPGDMAERMIAGMEAAMGLGGDGRCSCSANAPTACGVPPASFTHSAYTGFFIVARPGDEAGGCEGTLGCATGDYYVNLNFVGNANTLDPVVELRNQFDAWRLSLLGVPDHLRSRLLLDRSALVANGMDHGTATVELRDVTGTPVTSGISAVEFEARTEPHIVQFTSATDLGNGLWRADFTATQTPGAEAFTASAVLSNGTRIRLATEGNLASVPVGEIYLGAGRYSSSAGTELPVNLRRGSAEAGFAYRILASTSGTVPGSVFGGIQIPLNPGGLLTFTQTWNGAAPFLASVGTLDSQGEASALFALPSGRLATFVGTTLSFAAVVQTNQGPQATPATSILIEF